MPAKNCEKTEILPSYQANKVACYCFTDAYRRYEVPGLFKGLCKNSWQKQWPKTSGIYCFPWPPNSIEMRTCGTNTGGPKWLHIHLDALTERSTEWKNTY